MFRRMSGFEIPVNPPTAITVAGRDAWQVLLIARESKPYSLVVAFDEATGLLVWYAAEGTDFVTDVTQLATNESLPLATFVYDGPVELEELPVIEVDLTDGLWARVPTYMVDDGQFPCCSMGDRISWDGLLFRTTRLRAVPSTQGAPEITTTYAATPEATYTVRGVCRLVVKPMTVRLDVGGLDLAAEPGTFRDISASGNGEMVEAYSEDFETPEPGQWVEAEGHFVVPWGYEWDFWGGEQPERDWTVLDIWAARRHKSIGPWANRIPAGIDQDDPPRVKQWQNVKAFWVKLAPIDP